MIKPEPLLRPSHLILLSALLCVFFSGCATSTEEASYAQVDSESNIECPIRFAEIQIHNIDLEDEEGNTPGWVELQNTSDETVYLKHLYLTDDLENPKKWEFKTGKIKANSSSILFFCKKGEKDHVNLKLKDDGGSLFLLSNQLDIIDSVTYPGMSSGISYGINEDGIWGYYGEPSPKSTNNDSAWNESIAPSVTIETSAGFFKDSVEIKFPKTADGETIRCTQDGSIPNENSPTVGEKLVIKKNTSLRCATYKKGSLTTEITTNSYFIDEDVKMPIVSVSVDPSFFKDTYYFDNHSCTNTDHEEGYLKDTEYPVHVEYFVDGSSTQKKSFEIDAGISIAGACTRYFPKKSVNIQMREKYQDGRLKYKLFDVRPKVNKFKAFRLRNMGNRYNQDYLGDAAFTSMLEGTGIDYQRSQPVIVFYNGEYYGIHNIREKLDKDFVETNYDIDAEEVTVVEHRQKNIGGKDIDDYEDLMKSISQTNYSKRQDIQSLETRLDINNYIGYMAFEIYSLNDDWPSNNVRAWKSSQTPWKFMAYDIDLGFDRDMSGWKNSNRNIFDWIRKYSGETTFAEIFTQFYKNPHFRRAFVNQSAILFNTYFNAENLTKIVNKILDKIDSKEMDRDMERFPRKVTKNGNAILQWARERDISVRDDYREEFKLGDDISVSFSVKGDGYITVDGLELPNYSNYEGNFFEGNDLLLEAIPNINGSVFKKWSDGNKENPRLVSPEDGDSYTAIFE